MAALTDEKIRLYLRTLYRNQRDVLKALDEIHQALAALAEHCEDCNGEDQPEIRRILAVLARSFQSVQLSPLVLQSIEEAVNNLQSAGLESAL